MQLDAQESSLPPPFQPVIEGEEEPGSEASQYAKRYLISARTARPCSVC